MGTRYVSQRIAFVCPRFAEGSTVGGAETLLKRLALRAQAAGREVTFLTTCARDHFTWHNEAPPGRREVEGLSVHFFPVDEHRDLEVFLRAQDRVSRRAGATAEDEQAWLRNSVNSRALEEHLPRGRGGLRPDRGGPVPVRADLLRRLAHPAKTLLVPCLHDEPFAHVRASAGHVPDASVASCSTRSRSGSSRSASTACPSADARWSAWGSIRSRPIPARVRRAAPA